MKWKIVNADFNRETGISKVKIITNLGEFEGSSKLHEEDKDIISNYEGCRYAEIRALIKYFKAKIKNQEIKIKTINNLIGNMEKLYNYAKNTPEARFIRKQYYIEQKNLQDLKDILNKLEEKVYNDMQEYRKNYQQFIEKVNNKKNEK